VRHRLKSFAILLVLLMLVFKTLPANADSLTVTYMDDPKNKPLSDRSTISYGKVHVGKCGEKTLMLANLGHNPISARPTVDGKSFSIPGNSATGHSSGKGKASAADAIETCGGSLKPGGGCTIAIQFCPQAAGTKNGALKLLDGHKTAYELKLAGTGTTGASHTTTSPHTGSHHKK
jgi:centrosomal CEP192-like protein